MKIVVNGNLIETDCKLSDGTLIDVTLVPDENGNLQLSDEGRLHQWFYSRGYETLNNTFVTNQRKGETFEECVERFVLGLKNITEVVING